MAFLFKEAFAKYGYVGITPCWSNKGGYQWQLWIYLPLKSYWWLLEKLTLTPVDSDVKLYSALSVAIDAEGSVCAWKRKGRTAEFSVVLYNEKAYVLRPLYDALKQRGYRVHLYMMPKGKTTNYGNLDDVCHYIEVRAKDHVKRLLEDVELTLPQKCLKGAEQTGILEHYRADLW
ncbi:MAG: hypothetical protein QXQ28_01705 [Candidatus Nezhaarchaeales archaeon]